MQRLTAADASFLYMENPVVHMHVGSVLVLDPTGIDGSPTFDRYRGLIESRLDLAPVFRQRLLPTPLGIDHPVWADDPDFDLDKHVHHVVLKGRHRSANGFKNWVGDFFSIPLSFDKPLWELAIVEGLDNGLIAAVAKIHHAIIDGTSGTNLMAHLVDASTDTEPDAEIDLWSGFHPSRLPNKAELAIQAVTSRVTDPMRGVRALGRTAGSVVRIVQGLTRTDADKPSMVKPFDAPRTFFNTSLTPRRSVSFGTASLEDLRFTKNAFGVTLNDVYLAACANGLRRYLANHGEFIDRPLVASVPVSVHGRTVEKEGRNAVSNMFVRIPVHVSDPIEQLHLVNADTEDAKAVHSEVAADIMGDITEITPPALISLGSRLYSAAGLADRMTPIHNLVISNVIGPPDPVHLAGAQLHSVFPFGPLVEGTGINITAMSNMGNMDIGVIACPDVAPDTDDLIDDIIEGIAVLRRAAEAQMRTAG